MAGAWALGHHDDQHAPIRSLVEIRDEFGARLDRMRELDPEIPALRKRMAELDDILARRVKPCLSGCRTRELDVDGS
jgi:hypothetical protein